MPTYIAQVPLMHGNQIVIVGNEIELSEAQAKVLGANVTPKHGPPPSGDTGARDMGNLVPIDTKPGDEVIVNPTAGIVSDRLAESKADSASEDAPKEQPATTTKSTPTTATNKGEQK